MLTIEQLTPWIFLLFSQLWLAVMIHTPNNTAKLVAGFNTILWLSLTVAYLIWA